MRGASLVVLIVVAAIVGWIYLQPANTPEETSAASTDQPEMVEVTLPELTGEAALGAKVFASLCASCHGANAGGIEGKGPPLIHKIYEPGHHGDFAFARAAKLGVRSHHWRFGDMPPVEGITDADIRAATAYVRMVQRENGIF